MLLRRKTLVSGEIILSDLNKANQEYLYSNFVNQGFPIELISADFCSYQLLANYWAAKALTVVQNGREIYGKQNFQKEVETLAIVDDPRSRIVTVYVFRNPVSTI